MLQKFLILSFCFLASVFYGQGRYIYEFEKLDVLDTIRNTDKITPLDAADILDANLFIERDYVKENKKHIAFIYKKEQGWVVYKSNLDRENFSVHFLGYSDNKKYAFLEVSYNRVNTDFGKFGHSFLYIINLEKDLYVNFDTGQYRMPSSKFIEKEGNTEHSYYLKNDFQVIINNNTLTVLEFNFTTKPNEERNSTSFDSASGIYELKDTKLIKTHYYDLNTKSMKPLVYVNEYIALGMAFGDFLSNHHYMDLKRAFDVEQYGYTREVNEYGEELEGYEVWYNDKLYYFLILDFFFYNYYNVDVTRIKNISIISPEESIHGLHTGMTVEEILKKYPKAKPNIDLINDWEYIYLEDLNIRIEFKTDKDNRIARYKLNEKNGDFVVIEILNKNKKSDLITIIETK